MQNMQKICQKICKPVLNMQNSDKSIVCIFCIYMHSPLCWCTSYIANMVIRRGYTMYIPGHCKCHFWRFQMFNFGTAASPIRCTNYSVLQKFNFCSSFVHWILNKFKNSFKLVGILSSLAGGSLTPRRPSLGTALAGLPVGPARRLLGHSQAATVGLLY